MARTIHDKRLAGLYVEAAEDGLGIPREAIALEETSTLIDLAGARLGMAESEKLREHIPDEEVELQTWFLKITEDPEKRRMIFSSGSLSKLAELKDGGRGDCGSRRSSTRPTIRGAPRSKMSCGAAATSPP